MYFRIFVVFHLTEDVVMRNSRVTRGVLLLLGCCASNTHQTTGMRPMELKALNCLCLYYLYRILLLAPIIRIFFSEKKAAGSPPPVHFGDSLFPMTLPDAPGYSILLLNLQIQCQYYIFTIHYIDLKLFFINSFY